MWPRFLTLRWFILVLILITGLIMVLMAVYKNYHVSSINKWEPVKATIVQSYFIPKTSRSVQSSRRTDNQIFLVNNSVCTYSVNLVYTYIFDGLTYTSNGFDYSESKMVTNCGASEFQTQYAVGKEIYVLVNPCKPEQSYVKASKYGWSKAAWGILIVAVACLFLSRTKKRKDIVYRPNVVNIGPIDPADMKVINQL